MDGLPFGVGGRPVHGSAEERMGELDPVPFDDHETGVLHLRETLLDLGRRRCRGAKGLDRRAGHRRDGERDLPRGRRHPTDPRSEDIAQVARDRQGSTRWFVVSERPRDLEREEGIAARGLEDARHGGRGRFAVQPVPEQSADVVDGERSDIDPQHLAIPQGGDEIDRVRGAGLVAPRGEQGDRFSVEAPEREGERPGRRRIQPLEIVDGEDHRRAARQGCGAPLPRPGRSRARRAGGGPVGVSSARSRPHGAVGGAHRPVRRRARPRADRRSPSRRAGTRSPQASTRAPGDPHRSPLARRRATGSSCRSPPRRAGGGRAGARAARSTKRVRRASSGSRPTIVPWLAPMQPLSSWALAS